MASSPVRTDVVDQLLDGRPQLRKSCDYCVKMKRGCDGGTPCELCTRRNKQCIRSVKKRSGPAKGTKYCKRKPRKTPDSTSGEVGASAAVAAANTPSGGPSAGRCPLPPGGIGSGGSVRGRKKGAIKARPPPSKKIKREIAGGDSPHVPGGAATAAALAAGMIPHKFEGTPTPVGAAVGIDTSPPEQQVPWRGQEYGGSDGDRGSSKLQPAGLGGAGAGGIGTHRRGSSGTVHSYGSRRSSLGSIPGLGMEGGDRRYSLEADACSGSLLPFYFAPNESDGVSGGGGSGDGVWVGGDFNGGGGGGGGGRVVAEDGSGGGGTAEAEHAAMMMAARRSSLDEALYGACYKRASFSNSLGPPPSFAPHHQHLQHRHMSSSDGMAWNQPIQQADSVSLDQGQGYGAHNSGQGPSTCGGGGGDPAGGKMLTSRPSAFHSPSIGAVGRAETYVSTTSHEQQQQSSTSVSTPAPVLSTFEIHYAAEGRGGGGGGGGVDGSSTMPSLRDLLFDTGTSARGPPPMAPPLNEMSMVESS
eukprot:g12467.t1